MPDVRVGQVWRDCHPRTVDRTVRVLAVRDNNTVVVESCAVAGTCPSTVHVIARRRFRAGSRGYRLISDPPGLPISEYLTGAEISLMLAETTPSVGDCRAASALSALLTVAQARAFLDSEPDADYFAGFERPATVLDGYRQEGLGFLLWSAGLFALNNGLVEHWDKN